jgi:hypothetical protein
MQVLDGTELYDYGARLAPYRDTGYYNASIGRNSFIKASKALWIR